MTPGYTAYSSFSHLTMFPRDCEMANVNGLTIKIVLSKIRTDNNIWDVFG